ncbi:TPA: hypothetical protein ACPHWC_003088 [Pseudomonas aeruginosa]|uniref:hypothetical protein n=1 Tax=Pseudomonas aeruginosa TaxID=287 RepID=UPI00053EFA59|nr:hypothetical protein [Pseudomonas aeruginosa]EIU5459886.1 hypothetical protein [Pseudomonas aeruginosa]EIU5543115.1 hypothetical protein [Pseudomonas aeruginosa]EKW4488838.1 hypothetical protein [Pseudomonas aeruginosa]EKY0073533.1 hypothetical protein [Pseudomonas aeruginosa]EKY0499309.1 hypothetical protein [Pseudomonas aeruginosa]
MRLIDHARKPNSEYHFESSDEYCDPAIVDRAAHVVRATRSLVPAELAQLQTIISLEKLRYEFAINGQDIKAHGQQVQALRNTLVQQHGREPFDNGEIEKAFYKALNEEYGYVG